MVGEHPTQTGYSDDMKPAWRVACVAYRKVRRQGELHFPAWRSAGAAVLELRPDLDERTAGAEAHAAVHYASVYYPEWLWNGSNRPGASRLGHPLSRRAELPTFPAEPALGSRR